jgi:hypothetical protein
MNIQEMLLKSKHFGRRWPTTDLYIALIILLVGFASFGLGRLSVRPGKEPVRILGSDTAAAAVKKPVQNGQSIQKVVNSLVAENSGTVPSSEGKYVASKNGTAYYLPTCSGVSRIKEENKIWFDSTDAAEEAGYHKAANCKGL